MGKEVVGMPTDAYHDVIYRFTYYMLQDIAKLIPASIRPNQITLVAFMFSLISCACLYFIKAPIAYLYWALFNFCWFIFDALDGMHARITGQSSEFGGFLDHYLDNIFFIFMFSVFILKFDLLYPFYIFIILCRFTLCAVVFIVQNHTGKMYLTRFSGGGEFLLMTLVMIFSYLYPHYNLMQHLSNPIALKIAVTLHLESGFFMKLVLIFYLIGMVPNFIQQYRFARRELS